MRYRLVVAALVGVAFVVSACDDPAPTELSQDTSPSLYATPKKAISITGVNDLSGPVPGLPNIINPECMTVDAGTGMAHFKKCTVVGPITGDLVGDADVTLTGWMNLATGVSRSHGHGVLTVCHADLGCGSFAGPFKAEGAPGGQTISTANAHGTGDFHTLQLRAIFVERGNTNVYDIEGVIF